MQELRPGHAVEATGRACRAHGLRVWLPRCQSRAGADEPLVVVAGAEGPGLSDAALRAEGIEAVRVAMAPGVDSLNVASSIAVALHHLVAHRLG